MALIDTRGGGKDEPVVDALHSITESTIKPIVRRKLHVSLRQDDTSLQNQDALELVAEIQVVLFSEIRKRGDDLGRGIRDLAGFAATVAANACYQYLRSKFPVRTQQKNKLRYILSHHKKFAVWKDSSDRWVCGYSQWKDGGRAATPITLETTGTLPIERGSSERRIYESIMEQVFDETDGPVLLDELVEYVMLARGFRERVEITETAGEEDAASEYANLLRSRQPGADAVLETSSRLKQLWQEILRLSPKHRKALLLNLKDASGDNLIAAFPLSGTASLREIADALEMQVEDLAAIWNSLPWDDLRIAEHLGLTRQQVINLRQSARARLARVSR